MAIHFILFFKIFQLDMSVARQKETSFSKVWDYVLANDGARRWLRCAQRAAFGTNGVAGVTDSAR
jgi:hypothetical protein